MSGGPKCPRTFWNDKTGFKKYQSPNVSEIYRKMLLFDADLRTKKSLKHEISGHKNKDKSSHPGSVLTTQTWAPSQEIEQFYLGTSLKANGNLGCTVRGPVSGEKLQHESTSTESRKTVCDVMAHQIAGGHFGTRFTGVTPSPSENVREHFGPPDIIGRRT